MNRHLIIGALVVGCALQAGGPVGRSLAAPAVGDAAAKDAARQPRAPGIESPDYVWNEVEGEELRALRATGDPVRGAYAYKLCRNCHGNDAAGDAAGFYPRLAGQHATVLIKQLADVREGRRDNPKMYPFATEHSISTQQIADIAVYLQGLPVDPEHGRGIGGDMSEGARLYEDDCEVCHGLAGEGDADAFYPKLADQHYAYLTRQAFDIRDGVRRNANPEMVEAIERYTDQQILAVINYVSWLDGRDE
ncbi:cytochrome c553 [Thioflavicoccus mobilis 8321]|uniref:Cytochrome c553 n=1 Tax=Thioflavicoccus mobilis 8321 TaxID=765912 RepID=L0GZS0_9GAMM|nr:c-type cytochrome [Thioflavicoccus mobilis]AGA91312.1 cytochrome c553 [Thioflavicoccus mobilis 8321]